MIRDYYIVLTYVTINKSILPLFTTCTEINGVFFRIDDLNAYLSNKGGISNEEIRFDSFFLVNDSNDWRKSMSKFIL